MKKDLDLFDLDFQVSGEEQFVSEVKSKVACTPGCKESITFACRCWEPSQTNIY